MPAVKAATPPKRICAERRSCALEAWGVAHGLPPSLSVEFSASWRENLYTRGNVLFYQGNEPFALFFVCTGRVKLVRAEDGGRHKIVRIIRSPDFIGERSLIANAPYAATAEVMDTARICVIDAARFAAFWSKRPEISRALARQLATKLGEVEVQAVELALRTIRERLARLLSLQADFSRSGPIFQLTESRQELAELLGTSPEVISRTLKELAVRKLIALEGKRVRILDIVRLRTAGRRPAQPLESPRAKKLA